MAQPLTEIFRSPRMPARSPDAIRQIERLIKHWRSSSLADPDLDDDGLRTFLAWLFASGYVRSHEQHQLELAKLRLDAAGEGRLLTLVGPSERQSSEINFYGRSGRVVGGGEIRTSALPRNVRDSEGQYLLVTFSHPVCRRCGCTNENACPGGCYWAQPDLCSTCARVAAAARRGGKR